MGFFSIYLISCIHVLGVYILLPFRNFILEISEDVCMVGNNARCFLLISDFLSHVSSSNYKFLHKIFTRTFLPLVHSHFDLKSSLASLLTSNPLLSPLELVVEIMMDQFMLFLITKYEIRCVFSPNKEVTLISKPQA